MIQNAAIRGARGTRANTNRFALPSGRTDRQHASNAGSTWRATSIMLNLARELEAIELSAKAATESMVQFQNAWMTQWLVYAAAIAAGQQTKLITRIAVRRTPSVE